MSVTLEQVEQLRAHAAVSYEEARRALEACDGDLLDALILLEREGRIPPGGGRSQMSPRTAFPLDKRFERHSGKCSDDYSHKRFRYVRTGICISRKESLLLRYKPLKLHRYETHRHRRSDIGHRTRSRKTLYSGGLADRGRSTN